MNASFQALNFRRNPFEMVTPSLGGDIIWAGMSFQKHAIEDVYRNTFLIQARQVVLNWGPIGGGKTFAAYFFMSHPPTAVNSQECIHAYLRMPKEGSSAGLSFLRELIEAFGLSNIINYIQSTIDEFGYKFVFDAINNNIRSEEFTSAVLKLSNDDIKVRETMKSYIYGIATASELKKVAIFKPLKSDTDYSKFIAGIITCITLSDANPNRVFIWLDEMEDLIYFTSKQFKQFSQILRDLIDSINKRFTIFMNFTLTEGEEENVKILLGEALWSRINKNIRFRDFTFEDATTYAKDLIKHHQIESEGFRPFTEEGIITIINSLPIALLTPREINKKMSNILLYAIRKHTNIIDKDLVKSFELDQAEDSY